MYTRAMHFGNLMELVQVSCQVMPCSLSCTSVWTSKIWKPIVSRKCAVKQNTVLYCMHRWDCSLVRRAEIGPVPRAKSAWRLWKAFHGNLRQVQIAKFIERLHAFPPQNMSEKEIATKENLCITLNAEYMPIAALKRLWLSLCYGSVHILAIALPNGLS